MTDVSNAYRNDAGTDFSLGNVFSLSFSILGANFAPFAVLGALASIPMVALTVLFPDVAVNGAGAAPDMAPGRAIMGLLSALLIFPVMIIAQAMILFGAFQDMLRRPVRVLPSIGVGLARFLPIIGVSVVQGAGVLLGFALLIVPGIIVALAWCVALPVCVVEKLGPIASLRRSAALTKGHRWKLFGIYFLLIIVGAFIRGAFNGILHAIGQPIVSTIGEFVWEALYLAYTAILLAVIYRDLRVTREGVTTEHIAAVFD
jgi:hypothetical protein